MIPQTPPTFTEEVPDASATSEYTSRGFPVIKLSNNKAQMDMLLAPYPVSLKRNPRGYQEKLFINLTNYDLTHSTPNTFLSHAIDGPVFRMIAQFILHETFAAAITAQTLGANQISQVLTNPKTPDVHWYQWKEFKGGDDKKAQAVISRTLSITYNDTPGHKYPWTVTLAAGPGKKNKPGAVVPAGEATKKVQMQLSPVQMHQWMLLGVEALQALTITQMLRSPLLS